MIAVTYVGLHRAGAAIGTVIVIDVLRAFTTAAFAFAAGAQAITVVSTVEGAFALRDQNPTWLIMGEDRGLPVQGFDLDNSPAALLGRDLTGRRLIQRTSSGTQGVVRSRRAPHLFAASLCCARATASAVLSLRPRNVTMVITGSHAGGLAEEDLACAEYLEALIHGDLPDDQRAVERAVQRVVRSKAAQKFTDPQRPQFAPADLQCAVDVDRFPFAMPLQREGDHLVIKPAPSPTSPPNTPSDEVP